MLLLGLVPNMLPRKSDHCLVCVACSVNEVRQLARSVRQRVLLRMNAMP